MKPTSLSQLTDNITHQLDGMIDKGKYQQVWDIIFEQVDMYIKDSVNREPEFVGAGYSLKMDMDKTTQLVKGFCARFNVEPGQVFDAIRNDLNMKMAQDTVLVTIRKDDMLPAEMFKTAGEKVVITEDHLFEPHVLHAKVLELDDEEAKVIAAMDDLANNSMEVLAKARREHRENFYKESYEKAIQDKKIAMVSIPSLEQQHPTDKFDYDDTPAGTMPDPCKYCGMIHYGSCQNDHDRKVEYMKQQIEGNIDPNPNTKIVAFSTNYGRPKSEGIGSIIDAVVDGKIPEPPKEMILHLKPRTNTIAEHGRSTEKKFGLFPFLK